MLDNINTSKQISPNTSICTLFEGDYHLGLAAFINSLVRAGYNGTIWAGFRGDLPPWIDQLRRLNSNSNEYMVTDLVLLVFVPVVTDMHFANHKPQFMLDLINGPARECKYLWYFDPDIFIRCRWSFFMDWQRHGIALCQDLVNNILPENSPLRQSWVEIASRIGLIGPQPLNYYFNSGMVGVSSTHLSFLRLWKSLIDQAEVTGCNLKEFMPGTREMPFHACDQDALNIAAMFTEHPLTTMGPEAMGFVGGGFTMYHAIGIKPWRGSLLLRTLNGFPPSNATKFFFSEASTPIHYYSTWRLFSKRFACTISAFVGRFYRRR